jgi:CPA1 family monovalent cation:H+ antiporter
MIHEVELVIGLLIAVAGIVTLARRFDLPYPVLLVVGGLVLGLVPGLPHIALEPDLVFLIFLPPLLYRDAITTSWRDFRADIQKISFLAFGLVLVSTLGVGVVAHAVVPALPWSVAFVLGAIVAPTDAVAATVMADGATLPRRLRAILEGESLVNDATALVAYRFAVAAVLTGAFSPLEAAGQLVVVTLGGIVVGLCVGWMIGWVYQHLNDPAVENLVSLLAGFAAYLPAQELGVSGVIATVSAGIYLGRLAPRSASPQTRVQNNSVWEITTFVLNGLMFLLIGLQLPRAFDGTSRASAVELLAYTAVVTMTMFLIRLGWLVGYRAIMSQISSSSANTLPRRNWRYTVVMAWGGMRGAVSLAAALAIPATVSEGGAFPARDIVISLTFLVVLCTLIGQGLTFPWIIRALGVTEDDGAEREEAKARLKAARAAMVRLDQLSLEDWVDPAEVTTFRARYQEQADHYRAHFEGSDLEPEEVRIEASRRLRRELLEAEAGAIIRLRDDGYIADDVLRRVQRGLDLEVVGLDTHH